MYKSIIDIKKGKFGTFHKCLFHLHTPASYDYCLYVAKKDDRDYYKNLSDSVMYKIALDEGLFTIAIFSSHKEIEYDNSVFSSVKEYLTYLLIAQNLCKNDIKLVIISDHNTISGYKKLCIAVDNYCKDRNVIYPTVLLGMEISCGDKNHIVGIFNLNSKGITEDTINNWISDHVMSKEDGTYLTSIDVLSQINDMGGVGYLAHLDTSNIFKDSYLSDSYRRRLFNLECFKVIGLSDRHKAADIEGRISKYREGGICFVIDSDSHSIDTIKDKTFWIKGQKCNFKMIKKAFRDYPTSVELDKPQKPTKYIKGISVISKEGGFLSIKPNSDKSVDNIFSISFSESLNCFIGGRGTGKSTIINILEFVLGMKCRSKETLELICKHTNAMVLYRYHDNDYIIVFSAPEKEYSDDDILKSFERQTYKQSYGRRYFFYKDRIADYAIIHYIEVYRLVNQNSELQLEKVNRRDYLNKFFNIGFSVNELVQTAGSDDINKFINDLLFKNQIVATSPDVGKVRSIRTLSNLFSSIDDLLMKRNVQVHNIIEEYNEKQHGQLRIVYNQDKYSSHNIIAENLFNQISGKPQQYYMNYNIRNIDLLGYIDGILSNIGFVEFLKLFYYDKFEELNLIIPITNFCEEMDQNLVEREVVSIKPENIIKVFEDIKSDILNQANLKILKESLQSYITSIEYFELEFNVNNKEQADSRKTDYRRVKNLSLGQKVVAMLSFILSYGEYSGDNTPLIIDQPEDNLDNRYIFKNLVRDLRDLKSKRQVILATHSATIVTNAKAEQVIVMESDGVKGWVEKTGYPTEPIIVKYIINLLEGGIDSFNHKRFTYSDILKDEDNLDN